MNVDLCDGEPGAPGLVAAASAALSLPGAGDCIVGVLSPLSIESVPVAVREAVGRPARLDSPAVDASSELFAFSLPFFDAARASG